MPTRQRMFRFDEEWSAELAELAEYIQAENPLLKVTATDALRQATHNELARYRAQKNKQKKRD